jgi:hypothetical protein
VGQHWGNILSRLHPGSHHCPCRQRSPSRSAADQTICRSNITGNSEHQSLTNAANAWG